MSKIVVLTNAIGGLWSFRAELIKKIKNDGHDVAIYAPLAEQFKNFEAIGCQVLAMKNLDRRGINPIRDIKLIGEYVEILENEKPDVVLTYTVKPNIYGGIACRIKKIPYLSSITGIGTAIAKNGLVAKICMKLYKIGTKKVSCLFFQNTSNMKLFEERGIARDRHRLVPGSGVNLNGHSLKDYPSDDGKFTFLFVGRVMKEKGIEELLYAAEKLCMKYDNLTFKICGGCYDNKYLEQIDELAKRYDFTYCGSVNNIDDYYEAAHCVVLPSYHEGTANVMLEGQANGRPVISTDAPGCGETFEDGVSGFICKAKDADGLLDAMERMINLSNEERKTMGLEGRKNVEKNYDRRIVIDAYMEEIQKILEVKK